MSGWGRGPGRALGSVAAIALAIVLTVTVAACATVDQAAPSVPAASIGPAMTVSPTVSQTRTELVGVTNLLLSSFETGGRSRLAAYPIALPFPVSTGS